MHGNLQCLQSGLIFVCEVCFLQTMRVMIELLTKPKYTQLTTISNTQCGFWIVVSCGSIVVVRNKNKTK
jgi:prolipoprotein diacylglyceryltransferase